MATPSLPQPLIEMLGIANLSDEKKLDVIESVTEAVETRLTADVLEALPEAVRTQLTADAEANKEIDMNAVAAANGLDLEAMTQAALTSVVDDLVAAKDKALADVKDQVASQS